MPYTNAIRLITLVFLGALCYTEAKFVRHDVAALSWAVICCNHQPTPSECYKLPVSDDICTCFKEDGSSWPACMKKFCVEQEVPKVVNMNEKDVCDFMEMDGPFPDVVVIEGKFHTSSS